MIGALLSSTVNFRRAMPEPLDRPPGPFHPPPPRVAPPSSSAPDASTALVSSSVEILTICGPPFTRETGAANGTASMARFRNCRSV